MMRGWKIGLVIGACAQVGWAQVSSIGRKAREGAVQPVVAQEVQDPNQYQAYTHPGATRHSLIAVAPLEPRRYRKGDLITVIVRQQLQFETDADFKTKNDLKIESELDAFLKPIDGGLGASKFSRGQPDIDYNLKTDRKNKAELTREDRLTTRLTAMIIDIKPNGNLVVWARARIKYEEEESMITLTGTCAKNKVTGDGSILSTDLADPEIVVENKGSVRDGSKRGWLTKFVDMFKPL